MKFRCDGIIYETRDDLPQKVRFMQAYNPSTDRWVKIDLQIGRIVANKKTPGPYKGITELVENREMD